MATSPRLPPLLSGGADDPTESGIREKPPRESDPSEEDGLGFDTPSEARRLFSRPPSPHDEERALLEGALVAPMPVTSLHPAPNQLPQKPILASDCLREHAAPTEPGKRLLRIAAVITVVASVLMALASPPSALSALRSALFLAVGAVALLPRLDYTLRTRALTTLSFGIVAAGVVMRLAAGKPLDALLVAVVPFLAGSLLFRSYHRASRSARVGVGLGVGLGALWLSLHPDTALLGSDWSAFDLLSAFKVALHIVWISLLGLSLVAFMGPSTNAGGRAIGLLVVTWFVAESMVATWLAAGSAADLREVLVAGCAATSALMASLCFAQRAVTLSKAHGSLR